MPPFVPHRSFSILSSEQLYAAKPNSNPCCLIELSKIQIPQKILIDGIFKRSSVSVHDLDATCISPTVWCPSVLIRYGIHADSCAITDNIKGMSSELSKLKLLCGLSNISCIVFANRIHLCIVISAVISTACSCHVGVGTGFGIKIGGSGVLVEVAVGVRTVGGIGVSVAKTIIGAVGETAGLQAPIERMNRTNKKRSMDYLHNLHSMFYLFFIDSLNHTSKMRQS